MSENKIDSLIASLCEECTEQKPLAHPLVRFLPWVILAVVYLTGMICFEGVRHDFSEKIIDTRFLFEIGLVAFIGISAAMCSIFMCVPDMRGHKWLLSLPFAGVAVFTIWNIVHLTSADMVMPKLHMDHCMGEGAFMSSIPLAVLFFLVRKGTTTRPVLMAVMNVISVTAISYIGLRFTCAMDTVGHATISHVIPYVIIGIALGMAARKLYKW